MSEVNSAEIGMLIQSNQEIKEVQLDTNRTLSRLIEVSIRTEERQAADREWQKRVEAHQDKQDDKIDHAQSTADEAKNQALSNGKWINIGVAILTALLIYAGKAVFDLLTGG